MLHVQEQLTDRDRYFLMELPFLFSPDVIEYFTYKTPGWKEDMLQGCSLAKLKEYDEEIREYVRNPYVIYLHSMNPSQKKFSDVIEHLQKNIFHANNDNQKAIIQMISRVSHMLVGETKFMMEFMEKHKQEKKIVEYFFEHVLIPSLIAYRIASKIRVTDQGGTAEPVEELITNVIPAPDIDLTEEPIDFIPEPFVNLKTALPIRFIKELKTSTSVLLDAYLIWHFIELIKTTDTEKTLYHDMIFLMMHYRDYTHEEFCKFDKYLEQFHKHRSGLIGTIQDIPENFHDEKFIDHLKELLAKPDMKIEPGNSNVVAFGKSIFNINDSWIEKITDCLVPIRIYHMYNFMKSPDTATYVIPERDMGYIRSEMDLPICKFLTSGGDFYTLTNKDKVLYLLYKESGDSNCYGISVFEDNNGNHSFLKLEIPQDYKYRITDVADVKRSDERFDEKMRTEYEEFKNSEK